MCPLGESSGRFLAWSSCGWPFGGMCERGDKYLKETTLRRKCLFWLTGLEGSSQGHLVYYSVTCVSKSEPQGGSMW